MQERRQLFQFPVRNAMAKVLVNSGGSAKNGTLCARWSEVVPPEYFGNRKGPRQSWDGVKQKLFVECLRSMEDSGLIVRDNKAGGWAYAFTVTLTEAGRSFAVSDQQAITLWSDEEVKLFGHYTDERIAEITGRSVQAVQHYRNSKNMAPYMPKYRWWTQAEIDALGSKSDAEVSAALNRSISSVRSKRRMLGRPAVSSRFRTWTLEDDKQLGTMPDKELAAKLGTTSESVRLRRRKLNIPICANLSASAMPVAAICS